MTLRCAGGSDPGLRRQNNEDRIHCDSVGGLFVVVDGVGGQAAGERAAEIALAAIRTIVEQQAGSAEERLRSAIVTANNDIYSEAQRVPELAGMGCVVTAALVSNGTVTIGHVGDTRLYKYRHGDAVKVTHDHSPVGEQEESGELSEAAAMRHPMRNQVYKALGSAEHAVTEEDFVEIVRVPFEPDSSLLLCSDGLTDLVPLDDIKSIIELHAGDPRAVVERLIQAANSAGGKDNVSVIFVEGEGFAASLPVDPETTITRKAGTDRSKAKDRQTESSVQPPTPKTFVRPLLTFLGGVLAGASAVLVLSRFLSLESTPDPQPNTRAARTFVVGTAASADAKTINDALMMADSGDTVVVEPGDYREQIRLVEDVTLISRKPREAIILPAAGSMEPAVIIDAPNAAHLVGFEIRASPDLPLPIGILLRRGNADITDVAISGTRDAGVEIANIGDSTVRGSYFRANRGAAILVHPGASPRIAQNLIAREDPAAADSKAIEVQDGATPAIVGNAIAGYGPNAVNGIPEEQRARVLEANLITGETKAKLPAQTSPRTKPKEPSS
jgi:serine/threonine protein phosphatase PrpC